MQAETEQTEAELSARLSAIDAGLRNGEGDVSGLLEEREHVQRKIEAQRITKAARADEAYRSNNAAKSAEYQKRLLRCAETVADLVPRLLWECQELEELENESYNVPNAGFDETGIPYGFAAQLRRAIRDVAPNVEWHFDFVSDPNAKNPLPGPPKLIRGTLVPAFSKDIYGNLTDAEGNPRTFTFLSF
ncbi:MAG: hypothetical protein ABIU86_12770 [Gemmatimonadaceae bacterium]